MTVSSIDEIGAHPASVATPNTGTLIQVDRALQSWRDAGFDLSAAVGEVVDNSIEAGARCIRIKTYDSQLEGGKRSKASIDTIAFADDGQGIPLDILPSALTMGYSSRYNRRNGLGRFGVGAKLAALSQARRVDIWTRHAGTGQVYHTYFDLDEINTGEQEYLSAVATDGFPELHATLMQDKNGHTFEAGTLVVWSKVDRLEDGGKFGASVNERKQELIKYLGRTFRKFLQNGLSIRLDEKDIILHDPLFLLDNPRAIDLLGDNHRAEVVDSKLIPIEGHDVEITVTLLPKEVRLVRGEGGSLRGAERYKQLNIADNEGYISILRHGREIYYAIIPKLLPSGVRDGDRFIGIEIAFPAALDEYFQVRHVKRGAEPVAKLREEIRKFLEAPMKKARADIQATWGETATKDYQHTPQHGAAMDAFNKMEVTTTRGIGGSDLPPAQAEQILEDAARDLGASTPQEVEELKERIRTDSLTVIDGDWPGKEIFELQHVNGRVILKLNRRHPFMRHAYEPIKRLASGHAATTDPAELEDIARRAEAAIDLLLFSYAKAENAHRTPDEQYGSLRHNWGQFLAQGISELVSKG